MAAVPRPLRLSRRCWGPERCGVISRLILVEVVRDKRQTAGLRDVGNSSLQGRPVAGWTPQGYHVSIVLRLHHRRELL